jgi:hypothetical protein
MSTPRKSNNKQRPLSWLSHCVVGVVTFQLGFFLGGNHDLYDCATPSTSTSYEYVSSSASNTDPKSSEFLLSPPIPASEEVTGDEYRVEIAALTTQLKTQQHMIVGMQEKYAKERFKACQGYPQQPSSPLPPPDLFPKEYMANFAVSMARTSKTEFANTFDMGVPVDPSSYGSKDVLIIYGTKESRPTARRKAGSNNAVPRLPVEEATANCDFMNVVLTHQIGDRSQCIAIVPQYESYHVQKWMRIDVSKKGKLDDSKPLQMVSRGHQPTGRDQFLPPSKKLTQTFWDDTLKKYLNSTDIVLTELRPIATRIAIANTIVVMVCNFGQAELLMNFACSAKARGVDTSNVLVFATDQETADLAESVGLTAYYDHRVCSIYVLMQCFVFFLAFRQPERFTNTCCFARVSFVCFLLISELWRHSHRSGGPLRRSQICCHDDGQDHFRPIGFHAGIRYTLPRRGYRLVQEPARILSQRVRTAIRHDFSRRRWPQYPVCTLFGKLGLLLRQKH